MHPINKVSNQKRFGAFLQDFGLWIMAIILVIIFATLNSSFLTLKNFLSVFEQNATVAIVAVGVTFTIIAGQFDMSTGSVVALGGVILAIIFNLTQNMFLAISGALGLCLLCGLFNGILLSYVGINSVIVTLAAMIWARGIALGITGGDSVSFESPFVTFMNAPTLLGISPIILLIIFSYLFGWFILNRTRLGRYTYALGGDVEATKQAGINTNLYKLLIFLLSGFFVWLGTVIMTSRMSVGAPNSANGLEFDAIVAVIIGGSSMTGGEGNLKKTIAGVIFISILNNGLSMMGMRDSAFYLYKGCIILVALFFEVMSRKLIHTTPQELAVELVEQA